MITVQNNSSSGLQQPATPAVQLTPPLPEQDIHNGWIAPLADPAFHGLVGRITNTIMPLTEADPAAILLQTLCAFGNVIGHGPFVLVGETPHFLNLFVLIVGKTAKSRKGTSAGYVMTLFRQVDGEWSKVCVVDATPTGEGLVWSLRDPVIRRIAEVDETIDPGVTDKRQLQNLGEFVGILKVCSRPGSTLSNNLRGAWDHGNLGNRSKQNPCMATGAHLSIAGHITKDEARKYAPLTEITNGLLNRFLIVCVRRTVLHPIPGQIPADEAALLVEQLRAAVKFAKGVTRIIIDVEAERLWREVYETLSQERDGVVGYVTARSEAQVIRLAGVYALLDKSSVIQVAHLRAALAVWVYCARSAEYIFGQDAGTGNSLAHQIYQALLHHPNGLSRTEIHGLFNRNQSAAEIVDALHELTIAGKVRVEKHTGTGGRPTEIIIANPPTEK